MSAIGILRRRAVLALAGLLAFSQAAAADEIHVVMSAALTPPLQALTPAFERESGHKLIVTGGPSMGETFNTVPARMARGEPADVVIVTRGALDLLVKNRKVRAGSETDLANSPIAMAVKAGAPVPDISTTAKLKQVLLNAKSIAYSDSASGVYIETKMYPRLGIAAAVKAKSTMILATPVAETVARGEAEVGFQQLSELIPVPGITIVGLIPDEMQQITTFSAGIAANATAPAAGQALIAFLASPKAWKAMRDAGVEPASAIKGR